MIYGIIPARGGSVGVPRKALAMLGGRTLLSRAIATARATRCLDRIVVNTDDDEYSTHAVECGASVYRREDQLGGPHVPVTDVLHDMFRTGYIKRHDIIVLIQSTAPFTRPEDIDEAMRLLDRADAVVGCCLSNVSPNSLKILDCNGYLAPLATARDHLPRQEQSKVIRVNGSFYICRVLGFLEYGTLFPRCTRPYLMEEEHCIDIDTLEDLKRARDYASRTQEYCRNNCGTRDQSQRGCANRKEDGSCSGCGRCGHDQVAGLPD